MGGQPVYHASFRPSTAALAAPSRIGRSRRRALFGALLEAQRELQLGQRVWQRGGGFEYVIS